MAKTGTRTSRAARWPRRPAAEKPATRSEGGGNPLCRIGPLDHLREHGAIHGGLDEPITLEGPLCPLVDAILSQVRTLVERCVDALDDGDRALLQAASVAGNECCAALLAAASQRDGSDVSVLAGVEAQPATWRGVALGSLWPEFPRGFAIPGGYRSSKDRFFGLSAATRACPRYLSASRTPASFLFRHERISITSGRET